MRAPCVLLALALAALPLARSLSAQTQTPLLQAHRHGRRNDTIAVALFAELEELARVVDISYCVGFAGLGISKPFKCASRCKEFPDFELITAWNTGPLLSDSCGYIALSHPPSDPRIVLAFRGTYSLTNTIVDLSTIPQEYVPYPGSDDEKHGRHGGSPRDDDDDPAAPPAHPPRCANCTVHTGFYASWLNTRDKILADVSAAIDAHPDYQLTLVGHSLGGAVATLAALDFEARGWDPRITTFGEPRLGNAALMRYIDERFDLSPSPSSANPFHNISTQKFRRVTHAADPVPLLPLEEWGYHMHAGEIYIEKPSLPPSVADIFHCAGDEDPACIAGGDSAAWIPARFKLWQLFWAHRDYFWRIGLCVPGGDPWDWKGRYGGGGAEEGE